MSSSHQSKFPCIIITIIIILLFFSSFSTLLTVNLFVLFWRYFVMLNSYFVCFIIYIFFFNFEIFFVDIIFVPKIGVCFSFYPVSLTFEYEAKPHIRIRWPHIREYEAGESGANFTSVRNHEIFQAGIKFTQSSCKINAIPPHVKVFLFPFSVASFTNMV